MYSKYFFFSTCKIKEQLKIRNKKVLILKKHCFKFKLIKTKKLETAMNLHFLNKIKYLKQNTTAYIFNKNHEQCNSN